MENEHSNNCKLTEHMVLTKTRANSLSDITQINIWGFNLKDVSIFEKMENVEIVALSINQISTLHPFSKCKKLKQLFLRHNQICDFAQLDYLANLQNLTNLSLIENPISDDENYRSKVVKKLPQLKILDSVEINENDKFPKSCQLAKKVVENDSKQKMTDEADEIQFSHKRHRKVKTGAMQNERNNFSENEDFQQLNETSFQRKSYSTQKNNQKARTYNQRDFNSINQKDFNQRDLDQNNFNSSNQNDFNQREFNQNDFNSSNQKDFNKRDFNKRNFNQNDFNSSNQNDFNQKDFNQRDFNQNDFNSSNQNDFNQCEFNQKDFNKRDFNQNDFNYCIQNDFNKRDFNQNDFNQRNFGCSYQKDFSNSPPKNNFNGNNSILIAVLSLLPELTNEDLAVVLNSVQQKIYLNQCE